MVFHPTRVHIGTDHAAYELKEYLVTRLQDAGYEVADHGAHEYDSQDDYPCLLYTSPSPRDRG